MRACPERLQGNDKMSRMTDVDRRSFLKASVARPLIQDLRALMQDIDGIRPELSGGGQPPLTGITRSSVPR